MQGSRTKTAKSAPLFDSVAENSNRLSCALSTLAAPPSSMESKQERALAARAVLAEVQLWAPRLVWQRFGSALRALDSNQADSVVQDAVQHLLLRALDGSGRLRRLSDTSARAWCRSVLLNFVTSELRRLQRASQVAIEASELGEPGPISAVLERTEARDRFAECLATLRHVQKAVERSRRTQRTQFASKAVWCYLAHAAGLSLHDQIDIFGALPSSGTGSDEAYRRARDRVYQLRRRGLLALQRIVEGA